MALTFNNISVLSANSSSEFFGEQLRYKSLLELSIEGNFIDLSSNTYTAIHNAINAYETDAFGTNKPFYNNININGISFGRGYVRNFSTSPDGPDVGLKKYTINITIPVSSDNQNFNILTTSSDFGGLNLSNDLNLKFIQNFSESSSFTKGEGIKDSYSQNISITVVPEQKNNAKTIASGFIQRFLNNNNLSSLIASVAAYNKGNNIRKRHDQTYDDNTGTFSVNSNWVFYPRSSDGSGDNDVIVIRNVTVNYDSQGVINITEDGDCTTNTNENEQVRSVKALQKASQLLNSAWSRINTGYIDTSKHNPLINQPLSKNATSIPFQGKATYSITFTNSKEVVANTGYWSYNIVINQTQGGDFIGNESGEITGKGELLTNKQKYNTALGYWNNIKNSIKSRIQAYINGDISEISSSQVHSEIDGKISYNYSLSNNKSLTVTQNITKTVTSITEDYNRNLFSTFNIIGRKEIAQIQKNRLQNNIQINVVMNGKFTTTLSTYINAATSIASSYKQGGKLADINYNYSPLNREFSLNATYFYMP